ncbi:hypothetical protein [Sphingosinicella soli]|uniref:Uncharacterized protein n=1 Tax=Sphingosinicella soli TaxID=333708 RepID=A0A7W7B2X3_9SPHN|nr:hypothetical protein [Sphingosinicella soli]MBB4632103.1 hypothetical protein [Sphingosinicella soli]
MDAETSSARHAVSLPSMWRQSSAQSRVSPKSGGVSMRVAVPSGRIV